MSAVRALVVALGLAVALVAAGCGAGNEAASTTTTTPAPTTTTTTPPKTTTVRVYFLRGGQVWPVAREVERGPLMFADTLEVMGNGPTTRESRSLALTSAIPKTPNRAWVLDRAPGGFGPATLQAPASLSRPALAQAVYTLTAFPTVTSVMYEGKRYTRADFEEQTPPILVESPLSGQTVSRPIRVTGTANTFEATFQHELRGPDGKILSKHFEMATSGSGTRGTFDFTVRYKLDKAGLGKLVLYEDSAENGARIHVQEIPLELSP